MSLRDDWHAVKKKLEKAKMDTTLFKKNLSSLLDAFESALQAVDENRKELLRNDPKMASLRAKLKADCDKLAPVAVEYEKNIRYLADHATDSGQRAATTSAAGFMLKVINDIVVARRS
jgi:uncharacterized membrane protein YukC